MSGTIKPVIRHTCELVEALADLRRGLMNPDAGFADGLRAMGRVDDAAAAATTACAKAGAAFGLPATIPANDSTDPTMTAS